MFILLFLILECYGYSYSDFILFHWKGNLTHNSITMKIFPKLRIDFKLVYQSQNHLREEIIMASDQYPIVVQLENLNPDNEYRYYFSDLNKTTQFLDNFTFKTVGAPYQGYTFNMSMSGCARTGSFSRIFEQIYRISNPQLFIMLGDLHYSDINVDDESKFEFAYKQVFESIAQRQLYQNVPIEYQFDDHDYGKNDADGTSVTREVANKMYRAYVPHGNLHNYIDNSIQFEAIQKIGTYRVRLIGRTILIILDLRSFQNLDQLLGAEQRSWLRQIFEQIQLNQNIKTVLLISSINFHGEGWQVFQREQRWVAVALSELQENYDKTVLIISSDSHMTAFQNGFKNQVQDLGMIYKRGLTEVMCGSLDKSGSCKTDPVTFGPWLGRHHFTNVEVRDDGFRQVCIIVRGFEMDKELFRYDSCDETQRNLEGTRKCPMNFVWKIVYSILLLLIFIICYVLSKWIGNRKMD